MSEQTTNEVDINVFDYVVVVLKHKELVIKSTLAAMAVAALISLFLSPVYQAETKILTPQGAGTSMSSMLGSQMGIPPSAFGGKTAGDLYVALIKARGVADYVIDKYDLMTEFKVRSREAARQLLATGLSVRDDRKSGLITIAFQHRDPRRAADIANAYVEGLQKFNNNLAVTEAGKRRLFFEEQLKNAKENLIQSEENLKYFQQRTGTIKIDDEARAVIENVSGMRAKVSAKEVELRVMRGYATPENPDLQRLESETAALKEELRKMESKNRLGDDSVPTVGKMSSLGTEYIRRMREFRYNESLYEILMKQFEAAKLDESKDSALVQVVERAEPPEARVAPQRKRIVLKAGGVVFLISVLFILIRYLYIGFVANPSNRAEVDRFVSLLDLTQLIHDFKLDVAYRFVVGLVKKH